MRTQAWLAPLAAALFPCAVMAAGIQGIDVLSNRADLISGGDALVAVRLSPTVDPASVSVTLNGNDVTAMFALRQNGSYAGVVVGLAEGDNELRARLPDGTGARITLRNHPIGGPVFSGEQIQPWVCRTQLQTGITPGLGTAVDDKCNAAAPVVELFYRSTANQWLVYNPSSPPPASSILQTTTDEGKMVPFIIQRVTGTANRGIYQIAVLVDPTKPIEPWSTEQPWNRKYVNTFGGACSVNYQQPTVGDVRDVTRLGLGFAVGTSSLNTYANSCSDVISAEALMMTKEIITERWGPIRYTIGDGGSAGTMQQHMISGAYPGLLNGLMTNLLYEDHWYQVVDSHDCLLLSRYFGLSGAPAGWGGGPINPLFNTAALRQLVYGTNPAAPDAKCSTKIIFTATELIADSSLGCTGPAGTAWRWPTMPNGPRCTIQDYMKYVFGVGPDNKAPRPIDNVGVQYGLQNLLNGTLTKDRFVDANWRIGGMNIDGVWQPQRTQADLGALATLYRTGRITDGSGAANVAEIDLRSNPTDTGFHPPFHSWSWRARIDRTLGNHDNSVIWVQRSGTPPSQFNAMRTWLDAVYSDTSADPLPTKIARNKPADVRDTCYASATQGGPQDDLFCTGTAAAWQYYSNMRWVAGWPMTLDTFKCELKPLNRLDYVLPNGALVDFTDEEWAKLNEAFPTGVCDFSKPAIAQQRSQPWVSFAGGPGGQALGDAPKSIGVNPPVMQCRDVAIQACSAPQADVNNGSFDPDGDAFTLAQSPAGPYALGTTRVTLVGTDVLGLSSSCQANVRVFDQTPPTLSTVSASPASLWPPNKRMIGVALAVNAADNCTGNVTNTCRVVSISGDDAATSADWRITGALTAELRADRTGAGSGRTYTLVVRCTDGSGNDTHASASVVVPHDQGN